MVSIGSSWPLNSLLSICGHPKPHLFCSISSRSFFSLLTDDVDGQYAIVVELYALSSNTYKVMQDSKNYRMAACEVIDQVATNYS